MFGKLLRWLIPSSSEDYAEKHKHYCAEGKRVEDELKEERNHVISLLVRLKAERRALQLNSNISALTSDLDTAIIARNVPTIADAAGYSKVVKSYQTLKSHLAHIDSLLMEVTDKFSTSACHDNSGYYGLTDWAEKALARYAHLCDAIGGASVFGAGITYTTIFSATRGNASLMCWAFALFDIGFIITTLVRSTLMWCARPPLPKRPFASTFYWELVIHIALIFAFASATVAIFLLNMTIWQLVYPRAEDQDVIQLDLSPAPGAFLSMSVLAGAIFTVLVVLALIWWSNDFKTGRRHKKIRNTADIFV